MGKVVKSKREVRRECEDYQPLTEYERYIAERDKLKKYDEDSGIPNAHAE